MTYTDAQLALRGNRFPPLKLDAMTPEQLAMVDAVMTGKRASMQGPYNVLLRSPAIGIKAQAFGEQVRFGSSLGLRLNELAILLVARDWSCAFMWQAHREIAVKAGLAESVIDAIDASFDRRYTFSVYVRMYVLSSAVTTTEMEVMAPAVKVTLRVNVADASD